MSNCLFKSHSVRYGATDDGNDTTMPLGIIHLPVNHLCVKNEAEHCLEIAPKFADLKMVHVRVHCEHVKARMCRGQSSAKSAHVIYRTPPSRIVQINFIHLRFVYAIQIL